MSSVVAGDDVPGLACEAVRDEARSGRASQNGGSGIAGSAVPACLVIWGSACGCCLFGCRRAKESWFWLGRKAREQRKIRRWSRLDQSVVVGRSMQRRVGKVGR